MTAPVPLVPQDLVGWTRQAAGQLGVHGGRRLGQHFLISRGALRTIMTAAAVTTKLPVLEVGGGLGVLTLALMEQGARVTVVELDARLVEALTRLARGSEMVTVVSGDILKITDEVLQQALGCATEEFIVVANLPYEISGAFLRRFLSGVFRPQRMVLLLQQEVAQRLVARPGQTSLLTLSAELACAERQLVATVPPSAFWPRPAVTSAVVRLALRSSEERTKVLSGVSEAQLWQVCRAGFAARRKLLISNLTHLFHVQRSALTSAFSQAGLSPLARAQELSLSQWVALAQALPAEPNPSR